MNWLSPSLLYYALLAAVPIVLHFLMRERLQKVAFSAMRFLRKHSVETFARRRWLEWLLTALRVVCILILVTVFARPFFAKSSVADHSAAEIVILLDTSRSMSFGTRFADAQAEALKIVHEAKPGVPLAILTFDRGGPGMFFEAADAAQVEDYIRGVRAIGGSTDILAAIDRVMDRAAQKHSHGAVHLVSDMQASGISHNRDIRRLPASYSLNIHTVGGKDAPVEGGVAVEGGSFSADITPGEHNFSISVRVFNRGPERDVDAKLNVDGKQWAVKRLHLPRNDQTVATLNCTLREPGEFAGEVLLTGAPALLAGDDRFNFVVRVVAKVRVAIVNGHPSSDPKEDAALYIYTALNAGSESACVAEVFKTLPKLDGVDLVVLASVSSLPSKDVERLSAFVKAGGGMLIAAGPGIVAEDFNASVGLLSPARLRNWSSGEETYLVPADSHHALVTHLVTEGKGDLSAARFEGWWEVKDSQDARVVLRYSNHRPALLEKQFGKGTVVLFANSADLRTGDFPLRGIFVPFLRESLRNLLNRGEKSSALGIGDTLAVPAGGSVVLMNAPHGPGEAKVPAQNGAASSTQASAPGIYKITSQGKTELLAVNGDPRESDLTAADAGEFEKMISSAPAAELRNTGSGVERVILSAPAAEVEAEHRQMLWWWCAAALFVLSFIELWLAAKVTGPAPSASKEPVLSGTKTAGGHA